MQDGDTPLVDVSFVVVDLETTGLGAGVDSITEIGALKFVAGERVGTFQTLVDPGIDIPASITAITGIDDSTVTGAPPIAAVLPSFLEFIGNAVIVGHNVGFDLRFLHADLAALDYLPMANGYVDTLALARVLVRDEVTDCRLATLAAHFSTERVPNHRAFADAATTAELFHALLGRLASFGVFALDDLVAFKGVGGHPDAAKLRWVGRLPRVPGVFVLHSDAGRVLYVGAAADLRTEVRALFEVRRRSGVWAALHLAESLEHEPASDHDSAQARAEALIEVHRPQFNGVGADGRRRPAIAQS
ncbi:MAG: exonuclease domain-containing protein [Acidimicrobiales bacterium]